TGSRLSTAFWAAPNKNRAHSENRRVIHLSRCQSLVTLVSILWSPSWASSKSAGHLSKPAMCDFARSLNRFKRSGCRTDRHKTYVIDTDEAKRLPQIWRRHIDATSIHSGDEVAAARKDHDRRPILEQGQVSLRWIEPERQPRLRNHIDPLFQFVGNAEIPHRCRDQNAVGK